MTESYYSPTYREARRRFIERATAAGATLGKYSLTIENEEADEFTIDVAVLGPDGAPAILASSGLHGVEGFFGSAIQLAMLDELKAGSTQNIRWVFIHAINPFGFSKIRRFNEDNVDLNRNFLLPNFQYTGAPENYGRMNGLLNPTNEPSRYELFRLKALWNITRFGMASLKQCIAAGQYEYPRGIFYGGSRPSRAMELIHENCEQWIGSTQNVLHLDFHSGLGTFGKYKLLLAELADSEQYQWYERVFGHDRVEAWNEAAYNTTGSMGQWLQHHFADRDYRFVTAEFGTYGPLRVLSAIRAENRAHHFGSVQSQRYRDAKQELMECFCPCDVTWRQQTVTSGLSILRQGISGLTTKR